MDDLLFIVLQDPNPDDPLNKEAAVAFQDNPRRFEADVQRAIMHGHIINGQSFPPCRVR
jgi:ubiquitin-protein ligase